ncbi:enoyl-CoA hydratase-related protein [Isoalcanivorax indicus]|uniref:enoyl-CoA hydratase-related protein n=1 Tax=Isoalcanivorax indicus TaxID=2202653 RepID=UPI000DBA1635|nr:enoyl-CoA hydratase-related protein [Isoalcanivorax indicus]
MPVQLHYDDAVARITLSRPEKHNAFDDRVIRDLTGAFDEAGQSRARVIVLAAEGKHFSAGADLGWMRRMADMSWEENRADARLLAGLMRTIDQAGKPVIARVQGAAFGGALGLICAADIAVAGDSSRFCLSEARLGILPAVIGPYVVRAMGARQARRYMMTTEVMSATRALTLGVVHEVVADDALDDTVAALVAQLLNGAPHAQLRVRELVSRVSEAPLDDVLTDWTAELIAGLRTAEEGREGLDAFLNKRTPAWRPRVDGDES